MDSTTIEGLFRINVIKRHLSQSENQIKKCESSETSTLSYNFQYTTSFGNLTTEQRKEYEQNGFVVIRKLVSIDNIEKYKRRFQKICSENIKVPGMTVMKDISIINKKSDFLQGEYAITKIQDFTNDDELFEYCCLSEILQVSKSIRYRILSNIFS